MSHDSTRLEQEQQVTETDHGPFGDAWPDNIWTIHASTEASRRPILKIERMSQQ